VTIQELMDRLGGELLHGDASVAVAGVAEGEQADSLDLVFAEGSKTVEATLGCWAGAAVVEGGNW